MQLELLGAIAEEWVKMKLFYTANLLVTDYDSKVLLGKYFKGDFKDFNSNLIKETGYKDLIKNLLLFIGIGSLELKSNQKKLYTKAFTNISRFYYRKKYSDNIKSIEYYHNTVNRSYIREAYFQYLKLFTLWSAFEQLFKIEWKYNSKKFFIDKFSNKREEDYIKNFSAFIKVKCLSKSEVQNLENDLYTLTKDIFSLYEKSYKKKTKTAISFWKSFRTTIIYKDLKDGTRGDLFKENNGKLILNFQKQNSITKFIKLCYYFRNGFAHGYVTPSTLIDSPSDCVKIIKNLHAGLEVISTVVFFKILEEGSK